MELTFFFKLFLRRLPVMALFVVLASGLGVITAVRLPDVYQTSARLLVEAPQIPDSMVTSTVQTDAQEQLDIIEQKLLTRANLIDIAQKFDVIENWRDMKPDRVVEHMKSATRIRRSAGRQQATLMTIRFEGRSPRIVANVVNEYVTLVLAENTDARVSRAESTLDFFEQEVTRLARDLDQQSANIASFKSENANALPEDQSYRLGRQSLLQERLALRERELATFSSQREETLRIFEATGQIGTRNGAQRPRSPEEQRLTTAKAELELLLSTYSEENPRVLRLQNTVERLEAIVAAQLEVNSGLENLDENSSPERAVLEATLAQIDSRIDFLDEEIVNTQSELEELQNAILRSSANGIELAALEREYAIIQSRYDSAVRNLNEAQISERIETTAQGQRITTIENANVPSVPDGPNRLRIALMGAAAGLGLAAGYFFLLEFLNRSVRRPAELVSRFNVTPLTTIPYMESRSRRFARRSGLLIATLTVLIAVPALLYYIDRTYLPLEVVVQRGLERLGLG